MSSRRLGGVEPGRLAVFSGSLAQQPATVQREVAIEIERLGFGTIWYGESDGREAFVQGAMFLGSSERLVVASGIANVWVRDPTAMGAGGRALAEAWPKRFILGLGVGHAPMVDRRGHHYRRPVSMMTEYLDLMAEATWSGPAAPVPPIVLAALGPRMVALAGSRTAGAYPYFSTVDHARQVRDQLGPDPFLAADLPVVQVVDRPSARAVGDRHMRRYLSTENYRNNLLRLGWPAEDLVPPGSDALFDAIIAWGDRERIAAHIGRMFDAGVDQVVFNVVTSDASIPYVAELRSLSQVAQGFR